MTREDGDAANGRAGRRGPRRDGTTKLQSYELVVDSAAPAHAVFALLADGASWSSWGGPLLHRSRWYRTGTPAPGGVGAVRELGIRPVLSREEIVEFVPPRRMAYTIISGIPVRGYKGIVDLEPLPGGATRITWRATFVPAYRGTGTLLRLLALLSVGSLARHLARAAAAGRAPGASGATPEPDAPPSR